MMATPLKLVVLGLGYSASAFVAAGAGRFSSVVATVRTAASAARAATSGIEVLALDDPATGPRLLAAIAGADAMLVSVPAEAGGDPLLPSLGAAIAAAPRLGWIGYLSTVGVYGDHGGAWVDERSALNATSPRGLARIAAERAWLDLGAASGKAVQVFRLAGIYGPGRNQLLSVADGTARRIIKAGQVFSRIHVDDIAGACLASLDRPAPGAIYNVADHEPAPPQDVIAFAANLLGLAVPPDQPFETAVLSPMARSFYMDQRRVSNGRLVTELGYVFRHPTYREGLGALFASGEGVSGESAARENPP
ncbi:MAG: SDR family oxidoreductase [Beijerinckiaceae bacterium]|nr:SDR family oxidoreductase [Beijerinckiaceae bacterium]